MLGTILGACIVAGTPLLLAQARPSTDTTARPSVIEIDNIEIRGNVALPKGVYRGVLRRRAEESSLPPEQVQAILTEFLHRSGYDLASVEIADNVVTVDEGRLDSVVFVGASTGAVLGFKLSFNLPGQIFNRSLIEQELDRIVREGELASATWELVPAPQAKGSFLQLEGTRRIGTVTVFSPGTEYSLRIYVKQREYAPGFDLNFGFRPPDGIFVNTEWRFVNAFLPRDRITFLSSLGVDILDLADEPSDRLGITRAIADVKWFTPPLGVPWLRFFLNASARGQGRNRTEDIGVRSYIFFPLVGSANIQFDFGDIETFFGGGVEQRFTFRVVLADEFDEDAAPISVPADTLEPDANLRPFFAFGGEYNLAPGRVRKDRRHLFRLAGRVLGSGPDDADGIIDVQAFYKNTVLFGWDELRYGAAGAFIGGDVPFFNEVAFGDGFFRAAFLDELYTTRVVTGKIEYRFSISRDVFKLSIFNDVGVFEELDLFDDPEFAGFPLRSRLGPRFVEAPGVGLHALVLDVFQVDLYTGAGFVFGTGDGVDADVDISLSIAQVF
ncbi:MAG: hypothetical protein ACFB9M_08370 [Myxococcota bacterium]